MMTRQMKYGMRNAPVKDIINLAKLISYPEVNYHTVNKYFHEYFY